MSSTESRELGWSKPRIVYAIMVVAGALFVSTTVLPLEPAIARLVAVLAFGVMSGLWLAHLVYSL